MKVKIAPYNAQFFIDYFHGCMQDTIYLEKCVYRVTLSINSLQHHKNLLICHSIYLELNSY